MKQSTGPWSCPCCGAVVTVKPRELNAEIERLRALVKAFTAPNINSHAYADGTFAIDFVDIADAKRAFDALEVLERSSDSATGERDG